MQASPHGPDHVSRFPYTTRRGLKNALPVCWCSRSLVKSGSSWRQESRMMEVSSCGAISLLPRMISLQNYRSQCQQWC